MVWPLKPLFSRINIHKHTRKYVPMFFSIFLVLGESAYFCIKVIRHLIMCREGKTWEHIDSLRVLNRMKKIKCQFLLFF